MVESYDRDLEKGFAKENWDSLMRKQKQNTQFSLIKSKLVENP